MMYETCTHYCDCTEDDHDDLTCALPRKIDRLLARVAELEAALTRIADHESRADRRHRGMVDASEIQDLQRIARAALAAAGEGA